MTFPRLPGSADERDAEAVVAVLRRELLAPMDDGVVAGQLEAMLLEFDWEQEAAPSSRRPRLRTPAVVGSCLVAVALSLTSGLAAAGALPATAQHWLSRVTRMIGIPLPDAPHYGLTPIPTGTRPARVAPAPATTVSKDRDERSSPVVQPAISDNHPDRSTPSRGMSRPTRARTHPAPKSKSSSAASAEEGKRPANVGENSSGDGGTPGGGNGNGATAGAGKSGAAHAAHGPDNAGGKSATKKNGNPTEPSAEVDPVKKNAAKNAAKKNAVKQSAATKRAGTTDPGAGAPHRKNVSPPVSFEPVRTFAGVQDRSRGGIPLARNAARPGPPLLGRASRSSALRRAPTAANARQR